MTERPFDTLEDISRLRTEGSGESRKKVHWYLPLNRSSFSGSIFKIASGFDMISLQSLQNAEKRRPNCNRIRGFFF